MTRRRISAVIVLTIVEETDEQLIETTGAEVEELTVTRAKPFLAKCGLLAADDVRRKAASK
jgi:hypothetical protein